MKVEIVHTGGRWPELIRNHFEARVPGGIAAEYRLPDRLPLMLDDPAEFIPPQLGQAEVVLAIHLHPEILVEIPHAVKGKTTRALIAPIEDPSWIKPGLQRQVEAACEEVGIECAFPKPCCSLEPKTPVIAEFSRVFAIGRPILKLTTEGDKVVAAEVVRGSPCGLTDFVAQHLVGKKVVEAVEAAKVLHHSYPCMASMAMDADFGDTIMHESLRILLEAAKEALPK